jgi:dTMP kinase
MSELMLFMADRAQHMQELVVPALQEGSIVLCDRHMDSSVAYQGYGRGLDIEEINNLNTLAIQGQKPHLTLLFDGEPEELAKRVTKRGAPDRLEGENLAFYQRVREGYLSIAKSDPERFIIFNALQDREILLEEVKIAISARLLQKIKASL